MFMPCKSVPRFGEIRLGYVAETSPSRTHRYVGVHPYLIISNNTYNRTSGQCEVIPFTTKRFGKPNPVHVDFAVGEVRGLNKNSTLVIESRDTLLNSQLSEPIGSFTKDNWSKVIPAIIIQNPFFSMIQTVQKQQKNQQEICEDCMVT